MDVPNLYCNIEFWYYAFCQQTTISNLEFWRTNIFSNLKKKSKDPKTSKAPKLWLLLTNVPYYRFQDFLRLTTFDNNEENCCDLLHLDRETLTPQSQTFPTSFIHHRFQNPLLSISTSSTPLLSNIQHFPPYFSSIFSFSSSTLDFPPFLSYLPR